MKQEIGDLVLPHRLDGVECQRDDCSRPAVQRRCGSVTISKTARTLNIKKRHFEKAPIHFTSVRDDLEPTFPVVFCDLMLLRCSEATESSADPSEFSLEAREASASWQRCFNNFERPILHATHLVTPLGVGLRRRFLISRTPRDKPALLRPLDCDSSLRGRQSWQKQLSGDEVVGKGMGGDVKRAARMA